MKAIFITVRTASTRLPQKCLRMIGDQMAIELVIRRAQRCRKAHEIILCTTMLSADNVLEDIARDNGILCYRGSVEDKLMRWSKAARKYEVDFFVTMDGDDLLCDPELVDLAFSQYSREDADFIEAPNVPCGAFTYGIKTKALNRVCDMKGTNDTEMITKYFKDTGVFKVQNLENVPGELQRPEIRLTLDYEEDLSLFRNIFGYFGNDEFSLRDAIRYLDEYPEVMQLNAHRQADYLENQKKLTHLVLNAESV